MTLTSTSEMNAALVAAAQWRLLGLLFERPRSDWAEEIESLSREVEDPTLQRAATAAQDAREVEYIGILGPGGVVSPREVGYRGMHDPGHILSDIVAFHRAFGFQPRVEDPVDHVAVEASFMGYLHLKTAYALASSDADSAQTAASAAANFVQSHLQFFGAPLAERLAAVGPEYLVLASRALASRTGAPPMMPQLESDASELECGGCADLSASLPPIPPCPTDM